MKSSTTVKVVIVLAAAVGLGGWYQYSQHVQDAAKQYNRIVSTQVNQGEYHEAAAALEKLLPDAPADIRAQAAKTLALCYRQIGDDPNLSLAQSADWYRKAQKLDPDSLTDQQRQALRAAGNQR